ncbi:MAG: hypothetical protein RR588_02000 [Solibacillus sp.]
MKEEFINEQNLTKMLDQYDVKIPKEKLFTKQSMYQRFIHYLASPAQDPFEKLIESANGYNFLKLFPLAMGLLLAIIQGVLMF